MGSWCTTPQAVGQDNPGEPVRSKYTQLSDRDVDPVADLAQHSEPPLAEKQKDQEHLGPEGDYYNDTAGTSSEMDAGTIQMMEAEKPTPADPVEREYQYQPDADEVKKHEGTDGKEQQQQAGSGAANTESGPQIVVTGPDGGSGAVVTGKKPPAKMKRMTTEQELDAAPPLSDVFSSDDLATSPPEAERVVSPDAPPAEELDMEMPTDAPPSAVAPAASARTLARMTATASSGSQGDGDADAADEPEDVADLPRFESTGSAVLVGTADAVLARDYTVGPEPVPEQIDYVDETKAQAMAVDALDLLSEGEEPPEEQSEQQPEEQQAPPPEAEPVRVQEPAGPEEQPQADEPQQDGAEPDDS